MTLSLFFDEVPRFGPGCYRVEPLGHCFLWVAANELPLSDALVPFLVARSGRPLEEFARWVADRRSPEWVLSMLRCLAMLTTVRDELMRMFDPDDDPEVTARDEHILRVLLAQRPGSRERLLKEDLEKARVDIEKKARVDEARHALRRVLARRQLALAPEDDARIEACTDLATLERWLDQAVTAASVSEALQ